MTTNITSPQQLEALAKALRDHGMEDEFRKAVRSAAGPVVQAVQDRVRRLSIAGNVGHRTRLSTTTRGNHRPLRETVAGVVKQRNDQRGVVIECDALSLPRDMVSLPTHMESSKGWRHPVFGNRNVWVAERAGPWFYPTVRKHQDAFRQALTDSLDDYGTKLAERTKTA